jgi:hypothetical protein
MQYDDFIGLETVYKEYKEISFQHVGIPYDDSAVNDYLHNFQWDFNSLIYQSIEKYIRIYLPKYICAFFDKNNIYTSKESSLHIGVSDSGLVKGIPFQGTLTIDDIFSKETVEYLVDSIECSDKNWLNNISITLNEIEYGNGNGNSNDDTSSIHPKLKEYEQKKKILDRNIRRHNRKYVKWQKKNEYYTQKLVDLYNHPKIRKEFISYLRAKGENEMIARIQGGEIIEQKPYDEIRRYREEGNNLYYWLCRWKDEMLEKIRSKKPIREKAYKNMLSHMDTMHDPMRIFTTISNMIPWWMTHNKGMKLYIVNFTFKHPSEPFEHISYKEKTGKWSKCFRAVNDQKQPCCMPYEI